MYIFRQLGNPETKLVGGFNPSEKYERQNGFIFPKFRGENKKYWKRNHLVNLQIYWPRWHPGESIQGMWHCCTHRSNQVHLFRRQLGACLKPEFLRSEKTFWVDEWHETQFYIHMIKSNWIHLLCEKLGKKKRWPRRKNTNLNNYI